MNPGTAVALTGCMGDLWGVCCPDCGGRHQGAPDDSQRYMPLDQTGFEDMDLPKNLYGAFIGEVARIQILLSDDDGSSTARADLTQALLRAQSTLFSLLLNYWIQVMFFSIVNDIINDRVEQDPDTMTFQNALDKKATVFLMVYSLTIFGALKDGVKDLRVTFFGHARFSDQKPDSLISLSCTSRLVCIVLVLIPEFGFFFALLIFGSKFILISPNMETVLLNCAALCFIATCDEMIYEGTVDRTRSLEVFRRKKGPWSDLANLPLMDQVLYLAAVTWFPRLFAGWVMTEDGSDLAKLSTPLDDPRPIQEGLLLGLLVMYGVWDIFLFLVPDNSLWKNACLDYCFRATKEQQPDSPAAFKHTLQSISRHSCLRLILLIISSLTLVHSLRQYLNIMLFRDELVEVSDAFDSAHAAETPIHGVLHAAKGCPLGLHPCELDASICIDLGALHGQTDTPIGSAYSTGCPISRTEKTCTSLGWSNVTPSGVRQVAVEFCTHEVTMASASAPDAAIHLSTWMQMCAGSGARLCRPSELDAVGGTGWSSEPCAEHSYWYRASSGKWTCKLMHEGDADFALCCADAHTNTWPCAREPAGHTCTFAACSEAIGPVHCVSASEEAAFCRCDELHCEHEGMCVSPTEHLLLTQAEPRRRMFGTSCHSDRRIGAFLTPEGCGAEVKRRNGAAFSYDRSGPGWCYLEEASSGPQCADGFPIAGSFDFYTLDSQT